MLARDTEWRQGDLLTRESAAVLDLAPAAETARRVVVVTHDCDLMHPDEPLVEVIVADEVETQDSRFTYAKNPRQLHLVYENPAPARLILELRHRNRHGIAKHDFFKRAVKHPHLVLLPDAKRVLKQWLAARYGRPAFPTEFEARLGERTKRKIEGILKRDAEHVLAVFFDLGEHRDTELTSGEPYTLSVFVVYDTQEGGQDSHDAREAVEHVAEQLRDLFETTYGRRGTASSIALENCEAVADRELSLADLRRLDQWRLEHFSHGGERGDFLPVGEMPP